MALDQQGIQEIAATVERIYGEGKKDGLVEAESLYFGKAARVLTGNLFAASLGAAAQMLRQHDAEAADFFHAKAAEMQAWVTPPRIESTEPEDGATGIVADNGISVKLVAPGLNPESVTDDNFYVTPASGGAHLVGDLVYDEDNHTITFTPANDLSPGVEYKVTIGAGLRASGGMTLGQDKTFQFTTAA